MVIVKYNGIVTSRAVDFAATGRGQDTLMHLVTLNSFRFWSTASCLPVQAEKNHRFRGL